MTVVGPDVGLVPHPADPRFLRLPGGPVVANGRPGGSPRPAVWLPDARQVLAGFVVPYLPAPRSGDAAKVARAQAARNHARDFGADFRRVLHALAECRIWRGAPSERDRPFLTFDLRIINPYVGLPSPVRVAGPPAPELAPDLLRVLILIKVGLEDRPESPATEDERFGRVAAAAAAAIDRFRAVCPHDLPLVPIRWRAAPRSHEPGELTPALAGIGVRFGLVGELRRALRLPIDPVPYERGPFLAQLHIGEGDRPPTAPLPWPPARGDLLSVCSALFAARSATLLSVRLGPTLKSTVETEALHQRRAALAGTRLAKTPAESLLDRIYNDRDLFVAAVQVAGDDRAEVSAVVSAAVGDLAAGRPHTPPGRVFTISATEKATACFNLTRLEFLPWGGVAPPVHAAAPPAGNPTGPGVPTFTHFESPEELDNQDVFADRDVETDPRLARLRGLFTLEEAGRVWRLPTVPPDGHAGLMSRYPNPFEQLPEPTPEDGDAISLGKVQHRGGQTDRDFRVPLFPQGEKAEQARQPGIGDRVIVAAGSPGSGKTNFAISFLGQLWDDGPGRGEGPEPAPPLREKHPYLVIDPTHGNEFRNLKASAHDSLIVYTVGDERVNPFCFNPFLVPRGVGVQAHNSRLMSCFKAAYHMWDPLPAIFEMAIRRAYEASRKTWWERGPRNPHGESWEPAVDFPEGSDEPFPSLADVVAAMGTGEKGEVFPKDGRPTVIAEQKQKWGGDTENAHTIVASTSLRLMNLRDNYHRIIGGAAPNRPAVDLEKMLERPVVLELGAVGDSQALSLIMGFLVVSVVGTIESRKPNPDGARKMHVLVIEEAHRLLSGESAGGGAESGNSRAQAAQDINTLLGEIRKYGQGVMLLDQRPGSLVGGVIDNAFLIALHRLNEEGSFRRFAALLNLSADQQRFARTELLPGQMIVLDRRSGQPALVRPVDKGTDRAKWTDEDMKAVMRPRATALAFGTPSRGGPDGWAARAAADPETAAVWEELRKFVRGAVARGPIDAEARASLERAAARFLHGLGITRARASGYDESISGVMREAGLPDDEPAHAVGRGG